MKMGLRLFGFFLAAPLACFCASQSQVAQSAQADSASSSSAGQHSAPPSFVPEPALEPRCADIASIGPQFDPLAKVCQYALSQTNLPNFICQETQTRYDDGRKLDRLTTEVTFMRGRDSYSNWAINGHPIGSPYSKRGWVADALFGHQLSAIFRPVTKTEFKLDRDANAHIGQTAAFDFQFTKANNVLFKVLGSHHGLSGSIWVDLANGRLERVDAIATDIGPSAALASYRSSISYGEVNIPELGDLLLPIAGEVAVCYNAGSCFRNQLSFHDCRKFGSQMRIVPNSERFEDPKQ